MYTNEVEGFMIPEQLDWLHQKAKEMDSVVEVGCWKGRSTKALLDGCKGTVYAVDHFLGSSEPADWTFDLAQKEDVYQAFLKNVGHYRNLKVLKMSSLEAAGVFTGTVDMVFLDATHLNEDCAKDIQAWRPKCQKLLCGHDYPRVKQAVDKLVGEVKIIGGTLWYRYL